MRVEFLSVPLRHVGVCAHQPLTLAARAPCPQSSARLGRSVLRSATEPQTFYQQSVARECKAQAKRRSEPDRAQARQAETRATFRSAPAPRRDARETRRLCRRKPKRARWTRGSQSPIAGAPVCVRDSPRLPALATLRSNRDAACPSSYQAATRDPIGDYFLKERRKSASAATDSWGHAL